MSILRDGLLEGRAIALAGGSPQAPDGRRQRLRVALERLGARVEVMPSDPSLGEDEELVGEWARGVAPLHAVVYDARGPFGSGGPERLAESLERGWIAVREIANGALIPGEETGKVVLLGPPPGSGRHAEAARAGLENLARTLSVEWARYAVTAAMVAPGLHTAEEEISELVCFLVSPAGEYLSGCRLELGAAER